LSGQLKGTKKVFFLFLLGNLKLCTRGWKNVGSTKENERRVKSSKERSSANQTLNHKSFEKHSTPFGLPKIHLKPVQLSFQLVSENTSKTRDFRTGIPLCQICVTIFVEEKNIFVGFAKKRRTENESK
jgi:hypothetical protein